MSLQNNQYKAEVINAPISDSADYDYIVDTAIHNTIEPLWQKYTAKQLQFEVIRESSADTADTYGLTLKVVAMFHDIIDYADFKLSFTGPYNTLQVNENMELSFVKKC